jgi:hypothetical protein
MERPGIANRHSLKISKILLRRLQRASTVSSPYAHPPVTSPPVTNPGYQQTSQQAGEVLVEFHLEGSNQPEKEEHQVDLVDQDERIDLDLKLELQQEDLEHHLQVVVFFLSWSTNSKLRSIFTKPSRISVCASRYSVR